jgi:hypothetical protein
MASKAALPTLYPYRICVDTMSKKSMRVIDTIKSLNKKRYTGTSDRTRFNDPNNPNNPNKDSMT